MIFFQSKIGRWVVMASVVVFIIIVLTIVLFVAHSELKAVEPNVKNKKPPPSPHIVFIMADDMGWNDVSYHGSDQIPTPNIDALAYNGVILNNHYVQPVCTPSRAALLTGKYPIHIGMQGQPILATEKRGLPLKEKTIPQYLKKLGYSTHLIGKWHLGYYTNDFTPLNRGFDSHIGYWNGAISYYDHIIQELGKYSAFSGHDFRRNYTTAWEYQGKYATDIFTDEAINTIKKHDDEKPLFLYLSHLAVHAGNEGKWLEAPQETIDKFKHIPNPNRRTYAAMVAKLDESVGKVISALQEKDMLRDSIIVFLADNGAPVTSYFKNWGSNLPFRGEKNTLWEGGIRTAALIWSPLIEKSSRVSKQFMHVSDWLPTLFIAAGGKDEELSKDLDGLNMWPSINKNEPSPRKQVVVNIDEVNNYGALVVRKDNEENGKQGTYKFIFGKNPYNLANDFLRLDEARLTKTYNIEDILSSPANLAISCIADKHINRTLVNVLRQEATIKCAPRNEVANCNNKCLFDLDDDPCEQNDLSDSNSLLMQYMQDLYDTNLKTVVSQLPQEFDPAANPALFNYTWSTWVESPEFQLTHEYHVISREEINQKQSRM